MPFSTSLEAHYGWIFTYYISDTVLFLPHFVLYNKKNKLLQFFYFNIFYFTRKSTFAHFGEHEKSHLT